MLLLYTDLHVVLGFINTLYEASETDKATTIQIGLLNGVLREKLSLELTVVDGADMSRFR
jgi:hypothetical protein